MIRFIDVVPRRVPRVSMATSLATNASALQTGDHDRCPHHRVPWLADWGRRSAIDNVASWSYIGSMKTVGLRELKNRLSEYVREVRSGEGVLVTDRGEVVAELVSPGQVTDGRRVPSGLVALAKSGRLTLGADNDGAAYPKLSRLLKRHRAAELLDEERGIR